MAKLKIGFVRRGYASSGGAEAYLKRLAAGVVAAGHEARLFTTEEWPRTEWPFGTLITLAGDTPLAFADEVASLDAGCDILMSLERLWRCDVYRAGDGVHRAWLERRTEFGGRLGKLSVTLNRKHQAILRLEESLFAQGGAARVIANSEMVKKEIGRFYNYPAARIDVVRNGLPIEEFRRSDEARAQKRPLVGLSEDELAILFVGSGWERKGLRFAIEAVEACGHSSMRLLVAGRGNESKYRSPAVTFLGVLQDLPAQYAASDILKLPTIYDPFSNACLEALASGLPVITTSANGFSEIMKDGIHGSVIDRPDNIDAITAALRFWSDPQHRSKASSETQNLAAQFDISRNVTQTLQILML